MNPTLGAQLFPILAVNRPIDLVAVHVEAALSIRQNGVGNDELCADKSIGHPRVNNLVARDTPKQFLVGSG